MEKINIAELLKDCPKGMELDCALYDDVTLSEVRDNRDDKFPIKIAIGANRYSHLTKTGGYDIMPESKCVIYPKGKTTWEGFVPPCRFKDGNILATDLGSVFYLNTCLNTDEYYGCYVGIGGDGSFHICEPFAYKECCGFATEEEKQKLFQVIKDNGYRWNEETKTLEKEEKKDKFDLTTLMPFDKVLVRDFNYDYWIAAHFSHYAENVEGDYHYYASGYWFEQCVPYEGNEHLLGTTNDCEEFYKTWENEGIHNCKL